jgi:hypothetical protein
MSAIDIARGLTQLRPNWNIDGPYQFGEIGAVGAHGANTVDVYLDGSTSLSTGLYFLASYTPQVNDPVMIGRMQGSSQSARVVLGRLAPGGMLRSVGVPSGSINPCLPGSLYTCYSSGASALELPTPATQGPCTIGFINLLGNAVTITTPAGVIRGPGMTVGGVASFSISAIGAGALLEGDGANWYIVAGAQDSGWVGASLLNSWAQDVNSATAAYRIQGNRVTCRGGVKSGANNTAIFTLPAGFRPAAQLIFGAGALSGATPVAGTILVTANGAVTGLWASAPDPFGLDGVQFTVD